MGRRTGRVHVAITRRHYKGKTYEAALLRRSYREDGKVKNETLANLSHLPAACGARKLVRDRELLVRGIEIDHHAGLQRDCTGRVLPPWRSTMTRVCPSQRTFEPFTLGGGDEPTFPQ